MSRYTLDNIDIYCDSWNNEVYSVALDFNRLGGAKNSPEKIELEFIREADAYESEDYYKLHDFGSLDDALEYLIDKYNNTSVHNYKERGILAVTIAKNYGYIRNTLNREDEIEGVNCNEFNDDLYD